MMIPKRCAVCDAIDAGHRAELTSLTAIAAVASTIRQKLCADHTKVVDEAIALWTRQDKEFTGPGGDA
jgi:hypothetical protein